MASSKHKYLVGLCKDTFPKRNVLPKELRYLTDYSHKDDVIMSRDWSSIVSYMAIEPYEVVFIELELIKNYYVQFHNKMKKIRPEVPIVLISSGKDISVEIVNNFSQIFAIIPLSECVDEIPKIIDRIKLYHKVLNELSHENKKLLRPNGFGLFIGNSKVMLDFYSQLSRVSETEFTTLISGESGTGKELVAKSIVELGKRKKRPFISLNCAAIPSNLLESELFGYEKGAFTGANSARAGKFEAANDGSLFLDEIGDMSIELQAKLLRVLEDGKVERLGSSKTIHTNVRLIAATHQNLVEKIEKKEFRSDLHFRLNVLSLKLANLNERGKDPMLLTLYLLSKIINKYAGQFSAIELDYLNKISAITIPGNVRELENIITRSLVHKKSEVLRLSDLLPLLTGKSTDEMMDKNTGVIVDNDVLKPLWQIERDVIKLALKKYDKNLSLISSVLEISRPALYRKLEKYELNR